MTAKAGEHRTIRLPEDLVKRTDAVRGATPRERWIRALMYRVTGDLLVGRRSILLEFGPGGDLLDGVRIESVAPDLTGVRTQIADQLGGTPADDEAEEMPVPWEDDETLPDVEQLPPPGDGLTVSTEAVVSTYPESEKLRDRVDASRAHPEGPTEEEDELLAEAERLEATEPDPRTVPSRLTPDDLMVVARANRAAMAPRMRLKRPEAKP